MRRLMASLLGGHRGCSAPPFAALAQEIVKVAGIEATRVVIAPPQTELARIIKAGLSAAYRDGRQGHPRLCAGAEALLLLRRAPFRAALAERRRRRRGRVLARCRKDHRRLQGRGTRRLPPLRLPDARSRRRRRRHRSGQACRARDRLLGRRDPLRAGRLWRPHRADCGQRDLDHHAQAHQRSRDAGEAGRQRRPGQDPR